MDKLSLDAVIGLEVHAQLLTNSKIFSSDATSFGGSPNTHVSVVTLAHPGSLPKLNRRTMELAIRMGLACGSEISQHQIFDRKNYFYPDLPKGYQLTQDRAPVCKGGVVPVTVNGLTREVALHKIHLEEDAGKSIHTAGASFTQVDFNRAGVALIEIVTQPVIQSPEEAGAFLEEVRKLVMYLGICDGNMEEGSLRCDANVSVKPAGSSVLGKKVEIKNMNSVRNVQRAIAYEIERQAELVHSGEAVVSETRTFNQDNGKTYAMREKEELNDYRYFPDPDLSPVIISDEWLKEIKAGMPMLPREWFDLLMGKYQLSAYDAGVLTENKELVSYFESVASLHSNYKSVANWVMGPVKAHFNQGGSLETVPPATLAGLLDLVQEGKVSVTAATQRIFPLLTSGDKRSPLQLASELNLIQESNEAVLMPVIEEVIREFPLKVEEYKNGKKGIISMFMGEVMKRTKGKADPKLATLLITRKLDEL